MRRKWTAAEAAEVRHYRRASLYGSDTGYTAQQWETLVWWFGRQCLVCGATEDLTVDHVVPLSEGGNNAIVNLQILCKPCNSRKHTSTVDYRDPLALVQVLGMVL